MPEKSIKLGTQPLFNTGITWKSDVKGSGLKLDVLPTDFTQKILGNLPQCTPLSGNNEFADDSRLGKVSGFYLDGHWRSTQCKNVDTGDLERASKCFKNKVIYFIGDSTLRQWYLVLAKKLSLNENDNGDETVWQRPRHGRSEILNLTVHYIGHGSPLHGLGPPSSRPYVVDTVNGMHIGTGKDVYMVLNLALHFYLVDTVVYINRIRAIQKSIEALQRRSPDVTILIRGCLRHKISKIPVPTEWFSFRLCKVLRSTLGKVKGVGFIDTWAMTTAQELWDTHPHDRTVAQHVDLFTSYVCPI